MTSPCLSLMFSGLDFTSSEGVGSDAVAVRDELEKAISTLNETITVGVAKRELKVELASEYNKCSRPNWDGCGAHPVTFEGYCAAESFLAALPLSIPKPDVLVDPDGEFDFEWRLGNTHVASVSVNAQGELTDEPTAKFVGDLLVSLQNLKKRMG